MRFRGGAASLTRSLELEWIGLGVRVNAIAPGPVHTDYKARMDRELGRSPEAIDEDMRRRIPLGRRLRPDELQCAAIFLASAASSAVVGHMLVVDGGAGHPLKRKLAQTFASLFAPEGQENAQAPAAAIAALNVGLGHMMALTFWRSGR